MSWSLIRVDASAEIGMGHAMRCLAIANRLLDFGFKSIFVSRAMPKNLRDKLHFEGHLLVDLPTDNISEPKPTQGHYGKWLGTTEIADAQSVFKSILPTFEKLGEPTLIICDHYGLSKKWEQSITSVFKSPMLVIDDLSNRPHECDYLLDMTFGKTPRDYADLIPDRCQAFIGAEYALLRPEFSLARIDTLARRDYDFSTGACVKNILVSMGGMDKDNASQLVLRAIASLKDASTLKVEVLVSRDGVHLSNLQHFADKSHLDITIHGGTNDVAALYARADLCIGAAGSSTWERCCLGLPTINIVIADNQKTIAKILGAKGAIIDAGTLQDLSPKTLANRFLEPLINDKYKRKSLSQTSRGICDGKGVVKLIESISVSAPENFTNYFKLIDVSAKHIPDVYNWQISPQTRKYFVNTDIPTWEEHHKWMSERIKRDPVQYYIIEHFGMPAGLVRLEPFSDNFFNEAKEISILIAPKYYGKSLATLSLNEIVKKYKDHTLIAHILDRNVASKKLFEKCAFYPYKSDYFIYRKEL